MAKQELLWVANDGEIFDTESEALEHEAEQVLVTKFRLSETEIETLCALVDNSELAKAVSTFAKHRKVTQIEREKKHAMGKR